VRFGAGLLVLLQGAAVRVRCAWVLAPFQGVAAVELGCWCRCTGLRDVYGSAGRWGLIKIMFTQCQKGKVVGCRHFFLHFFAIWGLWWLNFSHDSNAPFKFIGALVRIPMQRDQTN
jgi:hypothetical protein